MDELQAAELRQKLTELQAELELDIRLAQSRDQHIRATRSSSAVASMLVSFFPETAVDKGPENP